MGSVVWKLVPLSPAAGKAALDLHNENVPAPPVLDGLLNVPKPLLTVFHEVEQADIMPPWNWSNNLLDNRLLRPSLGKSAHVEEVRSRKTANVRKLGT